MSAPLDGLQLVEGSAFVAAPSGGMTLAQLGADVMRFDQIGGGLDYRRWPITASGESLYWAGLNKGKRSIAVDLRAPEAQELLGELVVRAGNFLTNFPARGWMAPDSLQERRADLVMIAITGNRDGSTAVDYTINSAMGYPLVTGEADQQGPVNHVLPAWDLICGQTAALALLAADRKRLLTGEGSLMSLALSDVALASVAALGNIGEVQVNGTFRERLGNDLYGAFGSVFSTTDGRWVYAVGISPRQWSSLLAATESSDAVAAIESERRLDFSDEGHRFLARDDIKGAIQSWIGSHSFSDVADAFDSHGVCWGPYQTFGELVADDPRCSLESGLFREVEQPAIGTYLSPGSPVAIDGALPCEPTPAPALGANTEEILAIELGLSPAEIGELHDRGVVAGPQGA